MGSLKQWYFFVGAPKCGTTSVSEVLSGTCTISIASVKEPNYFCFDEIIKRKSTVGDDNFIVSDQRDLGEITHSACVVSRDVYVSLFDESFDKYIDFSTNYLVSRDAFINSLTELEREIRSL